MKAVLLFAGQGAQKVGMGKDLAEAYPAVRALLDQADTALGYSLTNVMFEGPMEELTKTSRCQPALYAHGLAILEVLKSKSPFARNRRHGRSFPRRIHRARCRWHLQLRHRPEPRLPTWQLHGRSL
jgi:malonyl CoA-acyl carrier protein transacylase